MAVRCRMSEYRRTGKPEEGKGSRLCLLPISPELARARASHTKRCSAASSCALLRRSWPSASGKSGQCHEPPQRSFGKATEETDHVKRLICGYRGGGNSDPKEQAHDQNAAHDTVPSSSPAPEPKRTRLTGQGRMFTKWAEKERALLAEGPRQEDRKSADLEGRAGGRKGCYGRGWRPTGMSLILMEHATPTLVSESESALCNISTRTSFHAMPR
ncbi:hypothetical protein IE81DRAFT_168558 [Ceraceosorus guamensis]|uniref:Uncharacterized protein n=1 Tax=Ceraceosorus guamensis TaxID=1522189 RepID=A0A316VVG4_9BASI|nr:hypothetical protein IE81DRAFT_168558 [Ceraceosorus guamensis]PWN41596.1 hypothetical protein IE81DRAFT_168558 [Ceraceosorus guamensis]